MFDRALQVQADAAKLGFDWPEPFGVLDKVLEETEEIREALQSNDVRHAQKELGDLLLVISNLSRFLSISPEEALAAAVERFEKRFEAVREQVALQNKAMESCSLEELEAIWQQVKVNFT